MPGTSHLRGPLALVSVFLAAAALTSCTAAAGDHAGSTPSSASSSASPSPSPSGPGPSHPAASGKPNIIFVLTDDLSWNLISYMPHVKQMEKAGTTFSDYYVTDSLCCPSRSSILTGEYPHDTGVFTNTGHDGGYGAFMKNGDEEKCFAPALQKAGYRTGFMGKYLNGYQPADKNGTSRPYVPPGWNEWDAAGNGYPEFNYNLNENGKVVHYGHSPKDYLTDVLSGKAASFVDSSARAKKPFMLELATFAPHAPSTPAPRDAHRFTDLKAPRTGAYDRPSVPTPAWQKKITPLTAKDDQQINRKFAKRVRSVQAVDAMIGHLQDELKAKGLADNTDIVFSSDNGFHLGEHRLRAGKQTPYDTDIKVPLIAVGPGIPAGKRVTAPAENVDLNPTFQDLAGAQPPSTVDGRSLVGLLHGGKQPDDWRQAVLVEHHHPASKKGDPDAAPDDAGNPPSYEALRTADALYVEYADGEREYYDTSADPGELKNLAASMSSSRRASLHATLVALEHCHGTASCRTTSRLHS
ncbi:sulfatase family protein [Streptomyces fuscigenes]|uniref:sulfatase family protein n=1 Tax=Streptomyces fuscigenes TaxID=1528880 RepID=UPI001F1673E9|nr:sulfatase [Streptomyces fuscigenes]MCF3960264.1 sulfatase [Streptomyces fuscigenes]